MSEIKLGTQPEFRKLSISDAVVIDEENQIVRITASSEFPVMRYDWREGEYYDEILSHTIEDIDLSRMLDGGPNLDRHRGDQVGVIEGFTIDAATKKSVVDIRFSKNTPRAVIIFKDVVDKIRKNVSVGYEKTRIVEVIEAKEAGKRKQVRFGWMPFEISWEPVPADPTVGAGRDKQGKDGPGARELSFDTPNVAERELEQQEDTPKIILLI